MDHQSAASGSASVSLFKKRKPRGAAGGGSSSASAIFPSTAGSKDRSNLTSLGSTIASAEKADGAQKEEEKEAEEEEEEEEGGSAVRRAARGRASGKSALLRPSTSRTDSAQHFDAARERKRLGPSLGALGAERGIGMKRSMDVGMDSDAAKIRTENQTSYGPEMMASLKAATPRAPISSGQTLDQVDDDGVAESAMEQGVGLYAEEEIPSAERIAELKEARRRAARNGNGSAAASGSGHDAAATDYISLADDAVKMKGGRSGRLQRDSDSDADADEQQDEMGPASSRTRGHTDLEMEEEEKFLIGKKERREEERRKREIRREAVSRTYAKEDVATQNGGKEDQLESDDEWEKAQLKRMGLGLGDENVERGKKKNGRPYQPAPIPQVTPLPKSGTTTSTLASRLLALEEMETSHRNVKEQANRGLQGLKEEEEESRGSVKEAHEKLQFFKTLEEFVIALAVLFEEKGEMLDWLERQGEDALVHRTQRAKRQTLQVLFNSLALFHGPPTASLDPDVSESSDQDVRPMDFETPAHVSGGDVLGASDQEAQQTLQEVQSSVENLLSDVHSSVFRYPCSIDQAEAQGARDDEDSVHGRFEKWRGEYTEEYNVAWGGLALADIWNFWSRMEMCAWDPFASSSESALPSTSASTEAKWKARRNVADLSEFAWHRNLSSFVERWTDEPVGGDEEAIATLLSSALLAKLVRLVQGGAMNVWDKRQTDSLLHIVDQMSFVLDWKGVQFQSFIGLIFEMCRRQIEVFQDATWSSVAPIPSPSAGAPLQSHLRSGDAPESARAQARRIVLEKLLDLLHNLHKWSRFALLQDKERNDACIAQVLGGCAWNWIRGGCEGHAAAAQVEDLVARILKEFRAGGALGADLTSRYTNHLKHIVS